MQFSNGHIPWNKGTPWSSETRSQMSSVAKGRASHNKGKKWSPELTERMRLIRKGQVNRKGPKGKPWSEERRKAQEFVKRTCIKRTMKPIIKNGKYYSPVWPELRKLIYKRDNYQCQECGVHCHNDKKIQCHHIDYDTLNNDPFNLITLCASCHGKTNFRRENWINHYRGKMKAS